MNVVKILLVLGLGYVAMTQKVEKTRNMLLVVTGLLAFCMFSVEGFAGITFGDDNITASDSVLTIPESGNTITGDDDIIYTFTPGQFNINTGNPAYNCPTNNVKADNRGTAATDSLLDASNINDVFSCVPKQLCRSADDTLTCSPGTKKSGDSDYCEDSTCSSSDFSGSSPTCCQLPAPNETCEAGKNRLSAECPKYYTDKAGENCAAATCVAADFSTTTQKCCTAPCSDDNCSISIWPSGDDGSDCGMFSKCKP